MARAAILARRPWQAPTPDGYTLLAMISSHVMNPFVLKSVPYDIDHDFAMISRTVTAPEVLVGTPSLPPKDSGVARLYEGQSRQGPLARLVLENLSHLSSSFFHKMPAYNFSTSPIAARSLRSMMCLGGQVAIMIPDLTIALTNIQGRQSARPWRDRRGALAGGTHCPPSQKPGCPASKRCNGSALPHPPAHPKSLVGKLHAAVAKALNDPDRKKAL